MSQHTNGTAWRAWLEAATAGLPEKLASRVREEMQEHSDSARQEAADRGLDPQQAKQEALESLGDPVEVNRAYDELSGPIIGQRTSDMHTPQLVWVSPEGDEQSLPLSSHEITIGRRANSGLVIPHPHASRIHAKLVAVDGGYELLDLDSHYGTFVNGQRIERRRLNAGDRIRIAADAAELSYF